MPRFNADFWEIAAGSEYFENVPVQKALWFETEEDRRRRHALCEFYQRVLPAVSELIDEALTERQKEILRLYYFEDKTQEDIARTLDLSQSTVSRHLFGTLRNGRRVGGAISKLRKVIERRPHAVIDHALADLQSDFAQAV